MKINIITRDGEDWFSRQISDVIRNRCQVYSNSRQEIDWDVVVVYEGLQEKFRLKCRLGGLIFISGEPPTSSIYQRSFLKQFDCILTSHKKIKYLKNILWQQSLPWHIGFSYKNKSYNLNYNQLLHLKPEKTKLISAMCSFVSILPGHVKRNNLVLNIIEKYQGQIDVYGKKYHFIDDKAEAILPYRFHLCIENSSIDDYWTEKLSDPILGYSIPIYIGCTNIRRYFPEDAMYVCSMEDENGIYATLDYIINNPQEAYEAKWNGLNLARKRILDEYNIIQTIEYVLEKTSYRINAASRLITIRPIQTFPKYYCEMFKLRIFRLMKRNLFAISNKIKRLYQ